MAFMWEQLIFNEKVSSTFVIVIICQRGPPEVFSSIIYRPSKIVNSSITKNVGSPSGTVLCVKGLSRALKYTTRRQDYCSDTNIPTCRYACSSAYSRAFKLWLPLFLLLSHLCMDEFSLSRFVPVSLPLVNLL